METIKAIIHYMTTGHRIVTGIAAAIVGPLSLLYLENRKGSQFMNGEHSTMDR